MISPTVSAGRLRFLLNLYPPFFFQGIRIQSIAKDFTSATVCVRRSIMTRNMMGTTFGGSLMAAADPILPILYWRILSTPEKKLSVWLKKQTSEFLIPADAKVTLKFSIDKGRLNEARASLESSGRLDLTDQINATLPDDRIMARFSITSSLRVQDGD